MKKFEQSNVEAIELAWKDLKVTSIGGDRTLLANASGKVQGSFLAIMGPSGSGTRRDIRPRLTDFCVQARRRS
jgi:hypothetical protein